MDAELIPIVGSISLFGWLAIQSYWKSKVRIEELRHANPAANGAVERQPAPVSAENAGEVAALRREVQALRDTTTKFDLSFDAALERLEQRMDHVEGAKAGSSTHATSPAFDTEPQVLRGGR